MWTHRLQTSMFVNGIQNTSGLKPFLGIWKHTNEFCATSFFFFHSSLAIQMTNWVKKVQRFVILCIIMLDIPSEKTGLWRLPNVSCAFRSRLYQRTSSKQLYPSCRVTVKLCDVIKPLCPRFTKEFGNYHELWDPTLIVILMNIQHSRSPVYNVLRRCLILYKKKRRRNKASLTSAFVVILIYTTD